MAFPAIRFLMVVRPAGSRSHIHLNIIRIILQRDVRSSHPAFW